jgi:hypothetical protein
MKHYWLDLKSVIGVTGGVTVQYMISLLFDFPAGWILVLLFCSMVAIVWMAIRILKDPYSTDKSFDDYFYQDREDIRRIGKEESRSF